MISNGTGQTSSIVLQGRASSCCDSLGFIWLGGGYFLAATWVIPVVMPYFGIKKNRCLKVTILALVLHEFKTEIWHTIFAL